MLACLTALLHAWETRDVALRSHPEWRLDVRDCKRYLPLVHHVDASLVKEICKDEIGSINGYQAIKILVGFCPETVKEFETFH